MLRLLHQFTGLQQSCPIRIVQCQWQLLQPLIEIDYTLLIDQCLLTDLDHDGIAPLFTGKYASREIAVPTVANDCDDDRVLQLAGQAQRSGDGTTRG